MQSMAIIEQAPYGNAQTRKSNKRSVAHWDWNHALQWTNNGEKFYRRYMQFWLADK